jgi:hypothetical protein
MNNRLLDLLDQCITLTANDDQDGCGAPYINEQQAKELHEFVDALRGLVDSALHQRMLGIKEKL